MHEKHFGGILTRFLYKQVIFYLFDPLYIKHCMNKKFVS